MKSVSISFSSNSQKHIFQFKNRLASLELLCVLCLCLRNGFAFDECDFVRVFFSFLLEGLFPLVLFFALVVNKSKRNDLCVCGVFEVLVFPFDMHTHVL